MKKSISVLAAVLCLLLCARAVNINPRNLTVQEGQYANFTCDVPCSHNAYWYIGEFYNSALVPFIDTVPGITYTRSIIRNCAVTDPGNKTEQISILATADLDRVAVQCSAARIDCSGSTDPNCGAHTYSRFRTLRVERRSVPSSTPSPSPAVTTTCPSPSTVVETTTSVVRETVTETKTETETLVSTVFEPVVSTVVVTETVSPIPIDPSSDTPNSGTCVLQSVGLSSAVIVTALIVVLSVLLRL